MLDQRICRQCGGLSVIVEHDEALRIGGIENRSSSVNVHRRGVKLLAQAEGEAKARRGMKLVREIASQIIKAIVAAGVSRLRVGKERPPEEKIRKCRARD